MTVLSSSELAEILDQKLRVTPEDLSSCLAEPPVTAETAIGSVEYSERGEGPVVLVSHGGPGGYDQGLVIGELFRKSGFRVIAPSRPGYLGSSVELGRTAEEQGDFMYALLEALNIEDVISVGVSGGGPAASQLAIRHPDRVRGLLSIDAISMHYTKVAEISHLEEWVYLSSPGQWLMGFFFKHFPAQVIKEFLQTESTLDGHAIGLRVKEIMGDENKFAFVSAMMETMCSRFGERKVGAKNDITMGAAIERLPLSSVQCPFLIVHGRQDNDVPPRDAEYAHKEVPGSQLLWIEEASHIGFWTSADALAAQRFVLDWAKHI
ncbi:alpha/beta hydrolase [Maridesulfovibrio sp.]|uniref:alpha/beta fold hydrolase n=1 Tax=Maridesulfovibrio sp. TaxID=2795000 RepID=UPI002A18D9B8|nr:alpha/beta hydrolase [Maridesulfovibrio sp.]